MRYRLPKPKFSLKFLFIALSLSCIGLWWYWVRPRQVEHYRRTAGRSLIHKRDQIYLESCFDASVKSHLITVLGDSRLTHWDSLHWIWLSDRKSVVSYGHDNALVIWNRADGSIRHGYYDVVCAAYAPQARQVFWADSSGKLRVIRFDGEKASWDLLPIMFPPAKRPRLLCTSDGEFIIHWDEKRSLTVWRRESTEPVATIQLTEDTWPQLCSPDNRGVVMMSSQEVIDYELPTGRIRGTLALPPIRDRAFARINAAAFSPEGDTLYTGDASGRVMAFDWHRKEFCEKFISNENAILGIGARAGGLFVASEGLRHIYWYGEPRKYFDRTILAEPVTEVAHGDSRAAAIRNGRIVIFDGDHLLRMKGGARADATCFAFSPDSKSIAMAGRDGQIVIRDTHDWRLVRSWKAHENWVKRLVWNPSGLQLASVADGRVVVWDLATSEEVWSAPQWDFLARCLAFNPTGQYLAFVTQGKEAITLHNTKDFSIKRALRKDSGLNMQGDMMFSRSGATILFNGSEGGIYTWSIARNSLTKGFRGGGSNARLETSDDPNVVFVSKGANVSAFDISTGKQLWTLRVHTLRVEDISRHPTLPVLATVGGDGTVALVDTRTGTLLRRLQVGPTQGILNQVDFSPDGELLAVAMNNGAVVVMESAVMGR